MGSIWKLLSSNGLLDLQLSSKHNCLQGFNQLISICSVKAVWQGSCSGSNHAFYSLGRSPGVSYR